ncbi:MAG: hypothetical protein ABI977_27620 [Acidobacteriota bacterium]
MTDFGSSRFSSQKLPNKIELSYQEVVSRALNGTAGSGENLAQNAFSGMEFDGIEERSALLFTQLLITISLKFFEEGWNQKGAKRTKEARELFYFFAILAFFASQTVLQQITPQRT